MRSEQAAVRSEQAAVRSEQGAVRSERVTVMMLLLVTRQRHVKFSMNHLILSKLHECMARD